MSHHGAQIRPFPGRGHTCKHEVPAGDLVGVIRQADFDWLIAD